MNGKPFNRLAEATEKTGADREQLWQEESVTVRLNRVLHRQLRQVEEALERLAKGDYGYCPLRQDRATSLRTPDEIGVGQRV